MIVMDDVTYRKMEQEYLPENWQQIRKERCRRRKIFMHLAPRSTALWQWHYALCKQFGSEI